MNKPLEQLPEPNLKGLKISLLKKQEDVAPIRVNHLDNLLDSTFIKNYFKEKNNKRIYK